MDLIQTRGSRHWREDISSMAMPNISITSVEINGSLAYVNYSIEAVEGGYTSLTLVAKKNSAPTSKTDGVTATITQSSTGKLMYLNNSSTYYFAIFAEYNGYTFRTPVVSYNTQSEITFVDTEIRNGVMYNKATGLTLDIFAGNPTIGYDSANNAISIYGYRSTDQAGFILHDKKWGQVERTKASIISHEANVKVTMSSSQNLSLNSITSFSMTGSGYAITISPNNASYRLFSGGAPLRNKLNAFHKVKVNVYYRNTGKAYKCEIYVDDVLTNQSTFSDVNDDRDGYTLAPYSSERGYMYFKNMKVTAIYND